MARMGREAAKAQTQYRKDVRRRKAMAATVDIERVDVRRLVPNQTPRKVA